MLDILRPVNKHLLYPFYYWRQGDYRLKRLRDIEPLQYWTPERLGELQLTRLKKLIRHAYEHTVYYKRKLDHIGFKPNDFQNLNDIQHLPLMNKSDLRDYQKDLIANNIPTNELVQDASGGSTGEPTIYYKDKKRNNLRRADQIRHDRWSGWDIGDRSAFISGAPRDFESIKSSSEQIITRFVERRWELNAYDMSHSDMAAFAKILKRIRPKMILGYANALFHFACFLQEADPAHGIQPRGIVSAAETLSDAKRKMIESVFQCKVLNRYGSREVGLIASECKHQGGLHINADNVFVEVLQQGKPVINGEPGEIVVTDLWNYGMPFIRYKMGDVGIAKSGCCTCGRGLPLLEKIEGRTGDFFVSKDGTRVHGEYFTHIFYHQPAVKKFQIIQESKSNVRLNIVETESRANRHYLADVEQQIKDILGSQVVVSTNFVSDIPPTTSGKYRFTISNI